MRRPAFGNRSVAGSGATPSGRQLEALALSQQALLGAGHDLDRIFDIVVDQSLGVIPHAHGAIVELLESDVLLYRAASGNARRYIGRRLPVAGSLAGRSIAAHRPMLLADLEQEPEIDIDRYRDVGMRALMAVPIGRDGHSFGALKFYSREPAAFAEVDLTMARLIAGQLIASLLPLQDEARNDIGIGALPATLPQLVWTTSARGEATGLNRRASDYLPQNRTRMSGAGLLAMIEAASRGQETQAGDAERKPVSFECRFDAPGGAARWFHIDAAPLAAESGEHDSWMCVGTDIDGHKALEATLRDAVRSRELLLSEVNHRAKNSLQIIKGLLAMHASRIGDPEAKARLMDARAQIATIADVHDTIARADQHDEIEMVALLRTLAESLIGRDEVRRAALLFEAPAALSLPIARGIPVALTVGEIIANAIKYATARPDPVISVTITAERDAHAITIADNGPGLPAGFDPRGSRGLGMDLIFELSRQAGASLTFGNVDPGACFRLRLPLS